MTEIAINLYRSFEGALARLANMCWTIGVLHYFCASLETVVCEVFLTGSPHPRHALAQ